MVNRINSKDFKNALSNLPSGVSIVTTEYNNIYYGLTISSLTSVSLIPPLLLFCINLESLSLNAFSKSSFFSVNILSEDQISLANHFAKQQIDKFLTVKYFIDSNNCPVFYEVVISLECKKFSQFYVGDHLIIVLEVISSKSNDLIKKPLLYCMKKYRGIKW